MEGQFSSSKADGLLAIWPLDMANNHPLQPSPLSSTGDSPPLYAFPSLLLATPREEIFRFSRTPTSCETTRTAKVKRQIAINGERVQLQRAIFHPLDPRRHVPPRATLGTIPATTCLAIGRTTCLCFLDSQIWIPIQGLPIWPVHHRSPFNHFSEPRDTSVTNFCRIIIHFIIEYFHRRYIYIYYLTRVNIIANSYSTLKLKMA